MPSGRQAWIAAGTAIYFGSYEKTCGTLGGMISLLFNAERHHAVDEG